MDHSSAASSYKPDKEVTVGDIEALVERKRVELSVIPLSQLKAAAQKREMTAAAPQASP